MFTLVYNQTSFSFAEMASFCYPPYSGILHPIDKPFIVCIDVPGEYYDDVETDVYEYIGKGLSGHQRMIRNGNEQIRVHKKEGKDILMFQKKNGLYTFVGVYAYQSHSLDTRCLKDPQREVIVFKLKRISDEYHYSPEISIDSISNKESEL